MYLRRLTTAILCCFASLSMAQSGAYDLRVTEQNIDLNNQKYYVDISIKAASSSQTFNLTSQNYKLSFDESVINNPAIDQELTISGFVSTSSPATNSFYNTHSLTGSIDSFLSYNVEFQGGDGYFVDELTWVPVGRVVFDLLDETGMPDLTWKTAQDFPATALTGRATDGSLYQLGEGSYSDLTTFGASGSYLIAVDDQAGSSTNTQVFLNVLDNDYALGGSIDPNSLSLVDAPNNGTATLGTGSFQYLPTIDYLGQDTFSYRICDDSPTVICDTAVVTIDIIDTEAIDDIAYVNINTSTTIFVLANDPNTNGSLDPSSLSITVAPSNGSATIEFTDQVRYQPSSNFLGTDSFTYEICFNAGGTVICDEAVVNIFVVNGNGKYFVSLATAEIDEVNMKYYADILISVEDYSANLANQNYRFSFSSALANPQVEQEFTISGLVEQTGTPATSSTYLPHTLTVSSDTVVSYDVILDSGDGYFMETIYNGTNYISATVAVGRISFDIVDSEECIQLDWHSQDPLISPSNYIEENRNGTITELAEGGVDNVKIRPGFNPYIFLEGPFDPTTLRMSTTLNELGLLPGQTPTTLLSTPTPAGQPYNIPPFNYTGTESFNTYDADIVDWVLIGFTESMETDLPLFAQAALLHSDGHIEILNPQNLPVSHPNPLYLHVVHRTHMAIAGTDPIDWSLPYSLQDYRRRNSYTGTAGFGQKEVASGVWAMYTADIDQEADSPVGEISGNDLNALMSRAGFFNRYTKEDANLDGVVNPLDKLIWSKNNGISTRVVTY